MSSNGDGENGGGGDEHRVENEAAPAENRNHAQAAQPPQAPIMLATDQQPHGQGVIQQPFLPGPAMVWQNQYWPQQPYVPYMAQHQQGAYGGQLYHAQPPPQQQQLQPHLVVQKPVEPKPKKGAGKVGRPKKRKSDADETAADPDYEPPSGSEEPPAPVPDFPKRSALDVSIGDSEKTKCCMCVFWAGRYLLAPCYHYSFCIDCLEKNVIPKAPKCPVCYISISKFILGYRSSINDIDFNHDSP